MQAVARFCLIWCLLFIAAHRLPAPIHEETPTPKPTIPAQSKPKQENQIVASKKKESIPAITAFVGTWIGTVSASFTSDVGLNVSGNASRTVIISSDGTVTYFGQSGGQTGPQSQSKVLLARDGRSASWTNQQIEQGGTSRGTYSLQLIGPNSALYQEDVVIKLSGGSGRAQGSGTLLKR
jgi:hypothetical protein